MEPRNSNGIISANQCRDRHPGGQNDGPTRQRGQNLNRGKGSIRNPPPPEQLRDNYASRTSRSRAPLWRRISEANFTADHTIIGGDFNHFEEIGTRGTAEQRRMHRRESSAWHQLTLQYGLTDAWTLDSFRKMSKKEFTFDNGRKGRGSAVSRIDKFLVSQELDARGGRIEAAPSIRRISDHLPLVLTI